MRDSARLTPSTSDGAASSARASATLIPEPPHSSTRVYSQTRPSETANVERSWPIATATSAASGSSPAPTCGACNARNSANASRSIPMSPIPAFLHASMYRSICSRYATTSRTRFETCPSSFVDSRPQRLARALQEPGRAVVRHARGSELRGADLQPDALLALPAAIDLDLRRLRALRFRSALAAVVLRAAPAADCDVALPERDGLLRVRLGRELGRGHGRMHDDRGRRNRDRCRRRHRRRR